MTTGEVVTLVGFILGAGGVGTILTVWLRRNREPIEQDSMALRNANDSIIIAQAVARDLHQEMTHLRERLESDLSNLRQRLTTETDSRYKLEERVDSLEYAQDRDRRWIRRTIERVVGHDPALESLLRPLPEWHTGGDLPAIPRPPDDGQPHRL